MGFYVSSILERSVMTSTSQALHKTPQRVFTKRVIFNNLDQVLANQNRIFPNRHLISKRTRPIIQEQLIPIDPALIVLVTWAGLGSYQQQDSAYGPSRGPTYATAGESGYGATAGYAGATADANYTAAAAGYGDQSFGRGAAATRGYHPYGR